MHDKDDYDDYDYEYRMYKLERGGIKRLYGAFCIFFFIIFPFPRSAHFVFKRYFTSFFRTSMHN